MFFSRGILKLQKMYFKTTKLYQNFIKFIIKSRNCNKIFSYMLLNKISVTQNVKLFLLQFLECSDTSINIE